MSMSNLVVCVGELLIDFFCTDVDVDLNKGENFLKKAGGAPANVAASISKLGGTAAFAGKVGNDAFGHFLIDTLDQAQVDTTMISKDNDSLTTMAFVSLKSDGERDFVFGRGADKRLMLSDIDLDKFFTAKIAHFGSATAMLGGDSLKTYFTLIDQAKEKDILVSFDPNYRGNLWKGREQEFIELSRKGVGKADFAKVSEEELAIITAVGDRLEGVKSLHNLGCPAIAVTLGKAGTLLSTPNGQSIVPSIEIKSVDSTGAGDAFVGATLFQLANLETPHEILRDFEQLQQIIGFANKVGALVCTKVGAISSLPTMDEVDRLQF
jgi:fructokinase